MNKALLYLSITCAALYLVQHVVIWIQGSRAALVSPDERKKLRAIATRGMIEGAAAVGLLSWLLYRDAGAVGVIAALVVGVWGFIGYCRATRMLILMQSIMELRKRTAKGGAMNSGALASMVSGAAGLIALIGAFIIGQPLANKDSAEVERGACRDAAVTAQRVSATVSESVHENETEQGCSQNVN